MRDLELEMALNNDTLDSLAWNTTPDEYVEKHGEPKHCKLHFLFEAEADAEQEEV